MTNITFERIEIKAFGGLKNTVIEPKAGVNMIIAGNGAGKTTIASFIKFIFYGFSGVKLQSIIGNERNMYIPWDSNFVEGCITVKTPKGIFEISRYFCKPSKELLSVTELTTGSKVLEGVCPGEYFFGISEDTFVKTAFFTSLQKLKNGDPALAQQLENLVFSADEMTSYSKAAAKLAEARTAILNRQNRGLLADARKQLISVENDLYTATAANDEILSLTMAIKSKSTLAEERKRQQQELNAELENIDKYDAKLQLDELGKVAADRDQSYRELEALKDSFGGKLPERAELERLSSDNAELSRSYDRINEKLKAIQAREHEKEAVKSRNTLSARGAIYAVDEPKLRRKNTFFITSLLLFLASAITFGIIAFLFFNNGLEISVPLNITVAACTGLFFILSIVAAISLIKYTHRFGYSSVKKMRSELAIYPAFENELRERASYIARMKDELEALVAEQKELSGSIAKRIKEYTGSDCNEDSYARELTKLYEINSKIALARSEYEKKESIYSYKCKSTEVQALEQLAQGSTEPVRTRDEVRRELSIINGMIEGLQTQIHEAEMKIAKLKEHPHIPSSLEASREILQARIDTLEEKKAAYELASEFLDRASTYMRSTISPLLTQYATEYFCEASCFNYNALGIDASLNLSFGDDTARRSTDYLSDGTRDTAYLCLRLALLKMIYRSGKPPLVLDDAFGHLDSNRLKALLKILASGEEADQIFIFTCRPDERKILEELGIKPNIITIQ